MFPWWWGCYIAALVWQILFPLVSISTGELKPRGLYVDENGLSVGAGAWSPRYHHHPGHRRTPPPPSQPGAPLGGSSLPLVCSRVVANVTCADVRLPSSGGTAVQLTVDHAWKGASVEATAVVVVYHDSNAAQSAAFAADVIARAGGSDWLAKRVVVVLLPAGGSSGGAPSAARVLDEWLDAYHRTPTSVDGAVPHAGLLRDAYVVDFSEPFVAAGRRGAASGPPSWAAVELLVAGAYGQLPNMDFVSAPLAAYPDLFVAEGDAPTLRARKLALLSPRDPAADALKQARPALVRALATACRRAARQGLLEMPAGRARCLAYVDRLESLASFLAAAVSGPSGLHGHFLARNIDAATLRPVRAPGGGGKGGADDVAEEAHDLAAALGDGLLRLSSNVHEELHHSHWFYLLMGSRHFVGLSEYAPSLLLALAPALAAFFHLSGAVVRQTSTVDTSDGDGAKGAATAVAGAAFAVVVDLAPAAVLHFGTAHSPPRAHFTAWLAARVLFVVSGVGGCVFVRANAGRGTSARHRLQGHAAAYAAALLLVAIAGVCVLGAQHYALAFPVAVALAPVLAGACTLGAAAGILPARRRDKDGPEPRWLRTLRPAAAAVLAAAAACGDVPFRGPAWGPLVPGCGALPAIAVDLAAHAAAALTLRLATLAALLPST